MERRKGRHTGKLGGIDHEALGFSKREQMLQMIDARPRWQESTDALADRKEVKCANRRDHG